MDHSRLKCCEHRLDFGPHGGAHHQELLHQRAEIQEVGGEGRIGVGAELESGLAGSGERRDHGGVCLSEDVREFVERLLQLGNLGEIERRQRDIDAGPRLGGLSGVSVDELHSKTSGADIATVTENLQGREVPTVSWLEFLGGDHDIGEILYLGGDLERRHETSVETEEVDRIQTDFSEPVGYP